MTTFGERVSTHLSYYHVNYDHPDESTQQHYLDVLGPVGALDLPGLPLEGHRLPTEGMQVPSRFSGRVQSCGTGTTLA